MTRRAGHFFFVLAVVFWSYVCVPFLSSRSGFAFRSDQNLHIPGIPYSMNMDVFGDHLVIQFAFPLGDRMHFLSLWDVKRKCQPPPPSLHCTALHSAPLQPDSVGVRSTWCVGACRWPNLAMSIQAIKHTYKHNNVTKD